MSKNPPVPRLHKHRQIKENPEPFVTLHTSLPLPLPFKSHYHQGTTTHPNAELSTRPAVPTPKPQTTGQNGHARRHVRTRLVAMQVLRLLAARRFRRRAVSTITASAKTAPATPCGCGYGYGEDEGPFFDLDLSCCSAPASSAESSSESEDSSSCAGAEVDFVISLQRSCSASPSSYERLSFGGCGWGAGAAPPPVKLKFCASEPNDAAARFSASCRRGKLRTLSFGSAKAAFYNGRASFSRSSSSARSARLFTAAAYGGHDSPDQEAEEAKGPPSASRDVIRRYLSKISRRLRRVAPGAAATDLHLRKSRSASAAQTSAAAQSLSSSSPPRRDDSLLEKQDGIASAIAHCKESLHRASVSECDSSLLRSRSDPGT